jgi:hypothetical protein
MCMGRTSHERIYIGTSKICRAILTTIAILCVFFHPITGVDSAPSDPREALLAYAETAKEDGRWVNNAYKDTQPTTQLHTQTLEQEEIAAKRQTTDLSEYSRANEGD